MKHPFFSIIVSTYNRKDQLLQCIQAIFDQSFTDFEVIVVDDCSTDDTMLLLESCKQPNFRFYKTETNTGGPATPRNIGLANAKGKWICFCDSDDWFCKHHLSCLYQNINALNLNDGILSSNAKLIIDYKPTKNLFNKTTTKPIIQYSLVANWKQNRAIFSSLCIRNSNIVLFNERNEYRSIEDYFFLIENIIAGKQHFYIDEPTIYYNNNSSDSIRYIFLEHGKKLFKYKTQLFIQKKLWLRRTGLVLFVIIITDYIKFLVKSLIKSNN